MPARSARTCEGHARVRRMVEWAARQTRIRCVPGRVRLYVRILVLGAVCWREPVLILGTGHQIVCDGVARYKFPRDCQSDNAKSLVRRTPTYAPRSRRRDRAGCSLL